MLSICTELDKQDEDVLIALALADFVWEKKFLPFWCVNKHSWRCKYNGVVYYVVWNMAYYRWQEGVVPLNAHREPVICGNEDDVKRLVAIKAIEKHGCSSR